MNILLYTLIFLIGMLVGNFIKNAIYKIPRNISMLKRGITYFNSENKSKIQKIMIQIVFLVSGGILFVSLARILQIDINNLKSSSIIMYLFTVSYMSILIIISGIDKKFIKIEKKIITSGIILSMIYIVYLYVINPSSIYFSAIILGIYLVLLTIDTFILRRYAKSSYIIGNLMLLNMVLLFSELEIFIYTIIMATIAILVFSIIEKIRKKKNGNRKIKFKEIPIGYFIGISNIIILFMIAVIPKGLKG